MRQVKFAVLVGLAAAAAACNQGNSDNVMSPEANALEPADVNMALGNELTPTANSLATNDMNAVGNAEENSGAATNTSSNDSATIETTANNSTE